MDGQLISATQSLMMVPYIHPFSMPVLAWSGLCGEPGYTLDRTQTNTTAPAHIHTYAPVKVTHQTNMRGFGLWEAKTYAGTDRTCERHHTQKDTSAEATALEQAGSSNLLCWASRIKARCIYEFISVSQFQNLTLNIWSNQRRNLSSESIHTVNICKKKSLFILILIFSLPKMYEMKYYTIAKGCKKRLFVIKCVILTAFTVTH